MFCNLNIHFKKNLFLKNHLAPQLSCYIVDGVALIKTMIAKEFMVQGLARPHIVSRFGTENVEPVDLVED